MQLDNENKIKVDDDKRIVTQGLTIDNQEASSERESNKPIVNKDLDDLLNKEYSELPKVVRNASLDDLLNCNIIVQPERESTVAVGNVLLTGELDFYSLFIIRIAHNIPTTVGIVSDNYQSVASLAELITTINNKLKSTTTNNNSRIIIDTFITILEKIDLALCRLFIIPRSTFDRWLDNATVDDKTYGVQNSLYDFVNRYGNVDIDSLDNNNEEQKGEKSDKSKDSEVQNKDGAELQEANEDDIIEEEVIHETSDDIE